MSLLQTSGENLAAEAADGGLLTPTSGTSDAFSRSSLASPSGASLVPPTDEERSTAKEATRRFFGRDFTETRDLVAKLACTRPNDPKVAVNCVVAQFCDRGCPNAEDFGRELADCCKKLNVTLTVPESLEDIDFAAIYLNKASVAFHLRQYRTAVKILRKLFQYVEALDDRMIVKVCFLLVECYLALQQAENALFVLNHAENHFLDKNCSASLHQSSTPSSTSAAGSNKQSTAAAASSSSSSSSPEKEIAVPSGSLTKIQGRSVELVLSERQKQKFQEYRIRAYLMARNLKACKKESKGFLNSSCSGATAVIQPFLKANVEYLKGNWRKAVHFLNLVAPAAKEEAAAFQSSSDSKGSFPFYVGGTFASDDELERDRSMEPDLPEGPWSEPLGPAFYNDLGCIHYHMGRLNLACHYFATASKEHDRVIASRHEAFSSCYEKAGGNNGKKKRREQEDGEEQRVPTEGWPIWAQGCGRKFELAYNLGIALLHAGKPEQAFDQLWTAARAFPRNPLLWLRVAEACIMHYRADNEPDFHFQDRKKSLVQGAIGHPAHRKLLLPTKLAECGEARGSDAMSPASKPVARLEFAEFCLRNALAILDRRDDARTGAHGMAPFAGTAGSGVKNDGGTGGRRDQDKGDDSDTNPLLKPKNVECLPGSTLKPRDAFNLRCSVLVASAYVSLRLYDSRTALERTRDLLSCEPYLSPTHRLLTHSYRAEALVMDDRITEAIRHLVADDVVGSEFEFLCQGSSPFDDEADPSATNGHNGIHSGVPQGSKHVRRWFPNNASTAKVVVQYNLTVAHAFRGELEKAGEALKQLSKFKEPNTEIPIQAMLLALYIQVQLGNVDIARKIIKQHCPQYR